MIISNFLLSRTSDQATVLNSDGSVVISTAPVQQPGVHVHEIIDPSASDNAFTGIIKKYIAKIPARVSWNKKTAYIKKTAAEPALLCLNNPFSHLEKHSYYDKNWNPRF